MEIKFKQQDIPKLAKKIIDKISKQKGERARVLALTGDLGSGKTTLTKEIAKQLGVKNSVISPTFVIMKFYPLSQKQKILPKINKLIHIDAYRLEGETDLLKFGWSDILAGQNLVIIEWPELIKKDIPKNAFWISLSHINEETRLASWCDIIKL